MLAIQLLFIVPILTGLAVGNKSGLVSGVVAGTLIGLVDFLFVAGFYTVAGWTRDREVRMMMRAYPSIFRVIAVPTDTEIVRAEGAEIQVGDYGWEAEAFRPDGRTYLHGLTQEWHVAWYAGFEPDQIEWICEKPRLQYSLPMDWTCIGCKPPACPYPVRTEPLKSLGFAGRIMLPFVQGVRLPKRGANRKRKAWRQAKR